MYPEADYSLFRFAVTRHPIVFCFVHLVVILWHTYVVLKGDWHWVLVPMTIAVEVGYWIGTWRHREKLRKLNEKGPGSPHETTVCEKCNPPCMVDANGKFAGPITNIVWWYAATRHVTREAALHHFDSLDNSQDPTAGAQYSELQREFAVYHRHPKFRK